MKKIFLILIGTIGYSLHAQNVSSNKESFLGVQAGLFGANVYYEKNISESFAVRGDIEFSPGIWGGDLYSKTGFAVTPGIKIAPKWYYNMSKRKEALKNTKNNSANYITANVGFVPDLFVISNVDGITVNPMVSIVPTWGLRRNFANNFNYEIQTGLGVGKILKPNYDLQTVLNLSFKIGYDF